MEELENNSINGLIYYCKSMIEQIERLKKDSNYLTAIKTIAFVSMLLYYGEQHLDDIYLAFLKTNFVLCDTEISFLEKINEAIASCHSLKRKNLGEFFRHCPGTFYNEKKKKNLQTKKYKFQRTVYVLKTTPDEILLKSIIHQMNHVVNSIKKPILGNSYTESSRMGISLDSLNFRESEGLTVEETINELQLREMMTEVLKLSSYDIREQKINEVLRKCSSHESLFNNQTGNKKLDAIAKIVQPLYLDPNFKSLLIEKRLSGDLNAIQKEFDSKIYDDAYIYLLSFCELCNTSSVYEEDAKALVKSYLINSKKTI